MHHKSLLALLPDIGREDGGSDHIDNEEIVGWIYMGSHNLTQAAWGNISSASASAPPQLTCQNWELGLVLPFRRRDLKADATSDAAKIVTWKRPVEKYQDGDVPWVSRRDTDILPKPKLMRHDATRTNFSSREQSLLILVLY